ncbi:MAG: NAD(P)H-binding protein [Flavobacteriaceae bacterium]
MAQISILGCGWLGFPLALSLQRKGHAIHGSTTTKNKLETLEESAIEPFLIHLTENNVEGNIHSFLDGSDVLILDIPPKMRNNPSLSFSTKIKTLIPFIKASSVKRVLFVSSTSVFSDDQGRVNEDTIPLPATTSGKELLKSEKFLTENMHFQTTILRFGGLTGDDRHPVNYLAGRKNISGANAPVNLIQQEDCIGIIEEIIHRDSWGHVFHGVHPEHPSKEVYYTRKADEYGLEPPQFKEEAHADYKTVDSINLGKYLHYRFKTQP